MHSQMPGVCPGGGMLKFRIDRRITVSMDVGTVVKREVGWEVLNEAVVDKTLNLDHEFVQYIISNSNLTIAILSQKAK